jgi:hypothetical protein
MKNAILSVVFTAATLVSSAQYFPQPSPLAREYQMVGLTEMEIEYSRPGVKGREIFGGLVPYDKLWRTGANMATKITFSEDVAFNGESVKAGSYAIFTIPKENEMMVMLNSNTEQGGTGQYDEKLNVVSTVVPFKKTDSEVERMRFSFENVEDDMVDLVFEWSDRMFTIPISVDTEAHAQANLDEKMAEIEGLYRFYEDAAAYYVDNGKDPEQAVEWAEKSVEIKELFWNTHTLARAYAAAGDKKKAKEVAERSLELSKEAEYQPYVERNEKLLAELK